VPSGPRLLADGKKRSYPGDTSYVPPGVAGLADTRSSKIVAVQGSFPSGSFDLGEHMAGDPDVGDVMMKPKGIEIFQQELMSSEPNPLDAAEVNQHYICVQNQSASP
jgi:hypothetical protein